ncbi:membrane protease subunit HflK [Caulobacter ginsengisoli]|uniref:Protein HflK n=1 Tax=Caulobacter ginsengisoli TaxID=400775 RepID=A0ABU0INT0_9CAUL|nr:FtsH protease activity modulator HflK [Caulobacter ginsengisoli]MDQ0463640.1 membrane protease subunit HflK [Caulobacter ginsengisoli]
MPWNDNANPGPWGAPPPDKEPGKKPDKASGDRPSPDREPERGPPPRRLPPPSGNPPPDLDELLRRLNQTFRRLTGGGGGNPLGGEGGAGIDQRTIYIVAGAVVALWVFSGIYIVQPTYKAVLMTFGAYTGDTGPGLHYHLPWPLQSVKQIDFTTLRTTAIGTISADDSVQPSDNSTLMLTGDENIVDLSFTVQWRVKDAGRFVFNIDNQAQLLTTVAESAMREVVGRTPLSPIISTGRGQVEDQTAALMQRILDSYGAGVTIVAVQIKESGPPKAVADAFVEVASAKQDAQKMANQAQGQAAKIVQDAKGYQAQVVQEAQGEAARFNSVYAQYKLAPGVTRQRLYIETMQKVLAGSTKVIVDSKGASAPIILPPDVFRPRAPVAQAPGAAQ